MYRAKKNNCKKADPNSCGGASSGILSSFSGLADVGYVHNLESWRMPVHGANALRQGSN
jgi:hypothetical protein